MSKLNGKIAFITGGTTGLGFATAERFLSEGADVIITGRRQAELDSAVKRLVFLASDDSSFVAGAELVVDGGMIAV